LALFAISATQTAVKKEELLRAKKVGPQKWPAITATWTINLLPFAGISRRRTQRI
jgi:hypothetical protein